MSQALYRKWRPQNFDEIFGQSQIKQTLKQAVVKDKIVHAYLFSGPRGSGKTSCARILAKAINCQNRQGANPCNQCAICRDINQGTNMDFIEIDAASNRGIEDIKDLREKVKFAPSTTKYKVFVIDEVHMLTKEAFNALLKTLEEPPPQVVFILATTEIHKVPATVISRCQRYDFQRLSQEDLSQRLLYIAKKEGVKIEEGAAKMIAKAASGSARDADSLLDLMMARGYQNITQKDVAEVLGKTDMEEVEMLYHYIVKEDLPSALALINKVNEEGKDIIQFTHHLIEYLREKMLQKPDKNIALLLKTISLAQKEMKTALFPQLPLELALAEIIGGEPQLGNRKDERGEREKEEKKHFPNQESEDAPSKSLPCEIDWDEVVCQIKPHNHSLCFLLKSSEPLRMENNKLILRVDYKFHKDKIEQKENRQVIEEVLKKITGNKIEVFCEVAKGQKPKIDKNEEGLIKEVSEVFGEG